MSRPILAKKRPGKHIFQTLAGHTEDALHALAAYLREHRETVAGLVREQDLSFREFCQVLFLALFLHDLGKATREFQDRLVKEELGRELSHTFFSLPLVHTDLPPEQNLLVRVLVLTHHTQPFDELYYTFDPLPRVSYMIEEIKEFLSLYPLFYERHFREIFPLCAHPLLPPQGLPQRDLREELRKEVTRLHREVRAGWPPARLKAVYCLAATLLKYCDSQASRAFLEADLEEGVYGPVLPAQGKGAGSSPGTLPRRHGTPGAGPGGRHRYALLLLPPGRQRLEAALARALDLSRRTRREKLVWITPAQHASGLVYTGLSRLLEPLEVEMVHAPSYFAADPYAWGLPPENGSRNNKDAGLRAHIFSAPVTVATLDHLVFSLVHGFRYADYALGNLLKSVVVVDGLPAPGSPALGYTLDALELLRRLHIPHIIVEGLLAPSLKAFLEEAGYEVVEEGGGFREPRFEPALSCGHLTQAVVERFPRLPRQVVFAPDAPSAARLARELRAFLPPEHLFVHHSLFNHRDRLRREMHLCTLAQRKTPWVLVTDGTLDAACLPACDAVHTGEAGAAVLVRRCFPLWDGGHLVLHLPEGGRGNRALPWHGGKSRLTGLAAALEEELRAHRPGPTNLREVFLACILSGPSPREVRYSRQPLVGLWPYPARLMDVLPQCFWDGASSPPPDLRQLCVKLPAAWHEQKAAWFSIAEGPAGKLVLCHLPYCPQGGLEMPA
ncbi:CRISPR-associated endonuclease Cas3'' [Desulfovirgula thermocuniculi]|uniref:CRISPR-associated endonuclease Cas3'' n=1 Tax=Desulfovirgula thermocuniculi TaxID=348842 RepID=UPI00054FD12F|nr:CRISPR-associated endonuclease Cas3'' [Desulfovirgula thermocuniculi]